MADKLGQTYVVLTVDEALYCKLMLLYCSIAEYQEFLIVRLGGFHTIINFLKILGQHMQSTRLLEVWTESNLMGQNTAENVMAGKDFSKADYFTGSVADNSTTTFKLHSK